MFCEPMPMAETLLDWPWTLLPWSTKCLLVTAQAMPAVETLLDGLDFNDDAAVVLDQALGPLLSTLSSGSDKVCRAVSRNVTPQAPCGTMLRHDSGCSAVTILRLATLSRSCLVSAPREEASHTPCLAKMLTPFSHGRSCRHATFMPDSASAGPAGGGQPAGRGAGQAAQHRGLPGGRGRPAVRRAAPAQGWVHALDMLCPAGALHSLLSRGGYAPHAYQHDTVCRLVQAIWMAARQMRHV
jgi:hypothetical protein